MKPNQTHTIILAAGKGTRMKSDLLKVAHQVAGKSIVNYVVDAIHQIDIKTMFLVIGHQSDLIKKLTGEKNITYVEQSEQLGTGHAVLQVESKLNLDEESDVLILAGDCPLITSTTLRNLLTTHRESNAKGTVLTTKMKSPASYGRILRGETGVMLGIREAKDCTKDQLKIKEINTGIYCFNTPTLFRALHKVKPVNKQGEYYLTDVIQILKEEGHTIASFCTDAPDEAIGVNTRKDLAMINKLIYLRNNLALMEDGVTILDPDTTFIDSTVKVGKDTIVYPFTMIQGTSKIGTGCTIGANSVLKDVVVESDTVVPALSRLPAGPNA